ncbi:hypothetical protein A5821_002027 [Enterococcus sp. 7F3_DIV0205]|uniref:Uncharacterized protein n=1 Tax=Candidatus Enterococcus palustris TaxID=1834189 RepID=A0AAQ3WBB1_9ENTE|nr:hypothetical protein [Enterococcus sp. 7F3_DIV0205]OTN82466.1 hypothetical protein A5821_002377 [Enterococcus sp. 7F3_DIV0205]
MIKSYKYKRKSGMLFFLFSIIFFVNLNGKTFYAEQKEVPNPEVSLALVEENKAVTIDVKQAIDSEKLKKNPKDLVISMNIEEYKVSDSQKLLNSLKVKSKNGTDYSADERIEKKAPKDNQFMLKISKELVEELVQEESTSIRLSLKEEVTDETAENLTAELTNNFNSETVSKKVELRAEPPIPENMTDRLRTYKNFTAVDPNGSFLSGKPLLDMKGKDLAFLKYRGRTGSEYIRRTIKVNGGTPNWVRQPGSSAIVYQFNVPPLEGANHGLVEMANVGTYKGRELTAQLVIPVSRGMISLIREKGNALEVAGYSGSSGVHSSFEFKVNILYSDTKELIEKDAIVIIPFRYSMYWSSGATVFANQRDITNLVIGENFWSNGWTNPDYGFYTIDPLDPDGFNMGFASNPSGGNDYSYNIIYSGTENIYVGKRIPSLATTLDMFASYEKMLIERGFVPTSILGTKQKTMKIAGTLFQVVPEQPAASLYKEMSVYFKIEGLARKLTRADLKLRNNDTGQDYTTHPSLVGQELEYDEVTKTYKLTFPKEFTQGVITSTSGDINLAIDFEGPAISDSSVMAYYKGNGDPSTPSFQFPIETWNSDTLVSTNESVHGYTEIEMQAPTGTPAVGQTVAYKSTSDAIKDTTRFFKDDVKSMLDFDEVEVLFAENYTFDTLGFQLPFNFLLKSKVTGVVSQPIQVKIDVIENPMAFVTVPDEIKLNKTNQLVAGEGKIAYTGPYNVNIDVETEPTVELKSLKEQASTNLNVFKKDDTLLKSGEILTTLNQTNTEYMFKLKANAKDFTKVDIYEGLLNFNFTVK